MKKQIAANLRVRKKHDTLKRINLLTKKKGRKSKEEKMEIVIK